MLKRTLTLVVVFYLKLNDSRKVEYCDNIQGYYWKDYVKNLPEDALPCGLDETKQPTFVGQYLVDKYLVVGKVYKNIRALYFYGRNKKEIEIRDNFMVLCTANPHFFEWIQVNVSSNIYSIKDRHLVVGGSISKRCPVYIGRTKIGAELIPGMISRCIGNGLLIACDNENCKGYNVLEVLSYHPLIKNQV